MPTPFKLEMPWEYLQDLRFLTGKPISSQNLGSDWDKDEYALLVNPAGQLLITWSIQFITDGDVNSVRYALEQVHLNYIGTRGSTLSVEGGPSLCSEVALAAGTYIAHPPSE